MISRHLPQPRGEAHLDVTRYRSAHFFGSTLEQGLRQACDYLATLTATLGSPPHVISLREELSWEDGGTDLAWQVTMVFSDIDRPS